MVHPSSPPRCTLLVAPPVTTSTGLKVPSILILAFSTVMTNAPEAVETKGTAIKGVASSTVQRRSFEVLLSAGRGRVRDLPAPMQAVQGGRIGPPTPCRVLVRYS